MHFVTGDNDVSITTTALRMLQGIVFSFKIFKLNHSKVDIYSAFVCIWPEAIK